MRSRIPLLAVALALSVPTAASAIPADDGPMTSAARPVQGADRVSPDARYGVPERTTTVQGADRVSPDARYGVPDPGTRVISVPRTEVVEADHGFDWTDAALGGGATLALALLIGGAALTVRPRRAAVDH